MEKSQIYGSSFVFTATRYEEWCDQRCTRRGDVNTTIYAQVHGRSIHFNIEGNPQVQMDATFILPMTDANDVLSDRVQYGRLFNTISVSATRPIVCNIFFNMTCIRFAMEDPLRIIEFYGSFIN